MPSVMSSGISDVKDDKSLIESLGGPAKLAERLGYTKSGGVQRVHNWTTRGIPARVKLEHPEIFSARRDSREAA